jgi:hypothetical protein
MENPHDTPVPEIDDPVPILGTWQRLYAAVVVSAVVVMILIAVFSYWAF